MEGADLSRMRSNRNTVLLSVGCLLLAGAAVDALSGTAPRSPSPEPPPARSSRAAVPEASRADRLMMQPAVQQQEIEKTQLPLTLLGTFAASEPSLSRATLRRRRDGQETLVVGVGDEIEGHALVVQIERERVVLREDSSLRELRLDGERAPFGPSPVATSERSGVPAPPATGDPLQTPGGRPDQANLERALRDTANGQVRVLPELEGDHLVGLHVSAIQEDSRFAQLGIEEDDVITQFNGISIDSPFVALHVVREMLEADGYHVMVRRGGATTRLDARWDGAGS